MLVPALPVRVRPMADRLPVGSGPRPAAGADRLGVLPQRAFAAEMAAIPTLVEQEQAEADPDCDKGPSRRDSTSEADDAEDDSVDDGKHLIS
jgi:hypothetical protein